MAKPVKQKRIANPRKHPAGREGGIRALASLRRQNLASVRYRHSPVEAQRERQLHRRGKVNK